MTTQEWKGLIRMISTATNSFMGHYKGVPIELFANSTLTRVWVHCNHDNIVPPKTFECDDELPPLYRDVFKKLYNTWHNVHIDNLPF